ncbi:MAG: 2-dehydro-3-deoxyglucarate aldolase [Pirellulales bacterium]|nr:2-dehydro-3-deoxyglucarate aldolase [Pirellulales bacterium]
MKSNPVKQKLRSGEPVFGTWLSMGNFFATRLLARMGFDWLTVDMEHQPFDWSEVGILIAAIAEAGCVPLVRVPEGNHHLIKRALDLGAFGIVVPMVNTAEQAKTTIAAAKYPPLGNRSLGGGMNMLNFEATVNDYFDRADDEIVVILQTESPQGVANAAEIYNLPGVDAIFVGPVDLRANMRTAENGKVTDEELEAAIQQIIQIGKKCNTPTGIHVSSPEEALKRAEQGMQFLAVGSDVKMLNLSAEEYIRVLYPDRSKKHVVRY